VASLHRCHGRPGSSLVVIDTRRLFLAHVAGFGLGPTARPQAPSWAHLERSSGVVVYPVRRNVVLAVTLEVLPVAFMVWTAGVPAVVGMSPEHVKVPSPEAVVEQSVSEGDVVSPVRNLTTTASPELKPDPVRVTAVSGVPCDGEATTESAVVIRPMESALTNQTAPSGPAVMPVGPWLPLGSGRMSGLV